MNSKFQTPTTIPEMKFNQSFAVLPDEPGWYFWTEWDAPVRVYKKPRAKSLFVTPPGGVEVRVTPRLAGDFTLLNWCLECGKPH